MVRITAKLPVSLDIGRDMARSWRNRWLELVDRELPVIERLQDAERSGTPATFSMEQVVELFALACSDPRNYGRPISHWTERELADEMVKQRLVESISSRHIGRLRRSCSTETPPDSLLVDPPPDEEFDAKVSDITQLYLSAISLCTTWRTHCVYR